MPAWPWPFWVHVEWSPRLPDLGGKGCGGPQWRESIAPEAGAGVLFRPPGPAPPAALPAGRAARVLRTGQGVGVHPVVTPVLQGGVAARRRGRCRIRQQRRAGRDGGLRR